MAHFSALSSDFSEDSLPPGQKPIPTSNVKRFNAFIKLLVDSHDRYPTMGVVTGGAGIGKTVAIQAYLDRLEPQLHTGLPTAIKVKVKPRATPKALALDMVACLKDKPRGRNIYEVADEAAEALLRNDLHLIIIDEGDRLTEDSFEVLRHIFDKTGCPMVVVGLPNILSVIDRREKFVSRVGLRMHFGELESQEVLHTVLPNLVFPHWKFDPADPTDQALGERMWKMVRPSLRKLRNLLQIASQIAEVYQEPQITAEIIEEAFDWSASTADKRRCIRAQAEDNQPADQPGEFERQSELRHETRRARRKERQ